MAAGSPQTIDRIQVEFSANIEKFNQDLQRANQNVDGTKKKMSSLETETGKTSKSFDKLSQSATANTVSLNKYGESAKNAGRYVDSIGDATKEAVDEMDKLSTTTQGAVKSTITMGDATSKAAQSTKGMSEATKVANANAHQLTDKLKNLAAPALDVQSAFNLIKGGLATLGVSAGVGALITQITNLKKAADDARKAYDDMYEDMMGYTGTITQEQEDLVNKLYERKGGASGFTDREQVTKAVAYTGLNWADATASQQEAIATEISLINQLKGVDAATFAKESKQAFYEWGITTKDAAAGMELLYQKSTAVGMNIEDLTNLLADNSDKLQALGYTFEQSADIVARSYAKTGSTKEVEGILDTYSETYESTLEACKKSYETEMGDAFTGWDNNPTILKSLEDGAASIAQAQVDAYVSSLTTQLKNVDAASKAWENLISKDSKILSTLVEQTKANQDILGNVGWAGRSNREAEINTIADWMRTRGVDTGFLDFNAQQEALKLASFGQGGTMTMEELFQDMAKRYNVPIEVTIVPKLSVEDTELDLGVESIDVPVKMTIIKDLPEFGISAVNVPVKMDVDETIPDITPEPVDVPVRMELEGGVPDLGMESIDVPVNLVLDKSQLDLSAPLTVTAAEQVLSDSSSITLNVDNFSGTIQMPDVVSASAGSGSGTVSGTAQAVEKTGFDILSFLGIGRASAADEVTFVPEWNGLDRQTLSSLDEISGGISSVKTGIDTLNTSIAGMRSGGDVYVTQNFYAQTVDTYSVKNAATLAVSASQAGTYRMRA